MLNFKTYLKEETSKVTATLNFQLTPIQNKTFVDDISERFSKYLSGKYDIEIKTAQWDEVIFYVNDIPESIYGNKSALNKFIKTILVLFPECAENGSLKNFYEQNNIILIFDNVPNVHVDFQYIIIDAPKSQITLSNIDKHITSKYLTIKHPENVTGNVLGLLKTNSKNIYSRRDAKGNFPEWWRIVFKHLEQDKNILKCQRELIQNGLKEYAKF